MNKLICTRLLHFVGCAPRQQGQILVGYTLRLKRTIAAQR